MRYSDNSKLDTFKEVIGHYEFKSILNKAIFSKKLVHILLGGRPGTAKIFTFELNFNKTTTVLSKSGVFYIT